MTIPIKSGTCQIEDQTSNYYWKKFMSDETDGIRIKNINFEARRPVLLIRDKNNNLVVEQNRDSKIINSIKPRLRTDIGSRYPGFRTEHRFVSD